MQSFYASLGCVSRGLRHLKISLCVLSRVDNSASLILSPLPVCKKTNTYQYLNEDITK